MGTDKATPRPWKAPFINDDEDAISITDKEQMYGVCICFESSCESKEANKANAELIVRAVNRDHLFEELVKALESAIDDIGYTPTSYGELLKKAKVHI